MFCLAVDIVRLTLDIRILIDDAGFTFDSTRRHFIRFGRFTQANACHWLSHSCRFYFIAYPFAEQRPPYKRGPTLDSGSFDNRGFRC